jgi:hypothetical protein
MSERFHFDAGAAGYDRGFGSVSPEFIPALLRAAKLTAGDPTVQRSRRASETYSDPMLPQPAGPSGRRPGLGQETACRKSGSGEARERADEGDCPKGRAGRSADSDRSGRFWRARKRAHIFLGFDEIHSYRSQDLFEALAPDPTGRTC